MVLRGRSKEDGGRRLSGAGESAECHARTTPPAGVRRCRTCRRRRHGRSGRLPQAGRLLRRRLHALLVRVPHRLGGTLALDVLQAARARPTAADLPRQRRAQGVRSSSTSPVQPSTSPAPTRPSSQVERRGSSVKAPSSLTWRNSCSVALKSLASLRSRKPMPAGGVRAPATPHSPRRGSRQAGRQAGRP